MSASSDVMEMQSLCGEIADRAVGSGREKERIGAVSRQLGVGWNRALEFLRGKARRVDSWEKDNALRQLAELKDQERRRREAAHLLWLESEIGRLRETSEEFHGPHVDGLEHFLRLARGADSAVAIPPAPDSTD